MSTFSTQAEAIEFGRDLARNDQVELLIHRADGQIGEKDSHGNDPPERGIEIRSVEAIDHDGGLRQLELDEQRPPCLMGKGRGVVTGAQQADR